MGALLDAGPVVVVVGAALGEQGREVLGAEVDLDEPAVLVLGDPECERQSRGGAPRDPRQPA